MPIYQKALSKGIRFYYKFDLNGKIYRSNAIYLTKGEAKKAEAEAYKEADYKQRHPNETQEISLLLSINERLDYVQVKKSKSYYEDNRRYLKILLSEIGDIPIHQITKASIENILLEKSKSQKLEGGDNYVVNAMLRIYKAMFGYIISKYELSQRNPCDTIKLFSVKKSLKYIPNSEEINNVLKLCDQGQRLLIETVRDTGARINEALRITGKDILSDYIVLYTRKSNNSDLVPRKVKKPECLNHISIKSDELLFGRWNEVPKFLDRKVRFLRQNNWSWHNLRHRYASNLSKQGLPLFEIMSRLGHMNLKTTQNYLQLLP